jgi:carboxymethylenebutenolidase
VAAIIRETPHIPCADGFAMPAHVARPDASGAVPGIVFMYEAFGMNDEMSRIADDLAGHGYAVALPDLFARGSWFKCVRRCFADFRRGEGQTFADLEATRSWLAAQPYVADDRLAILGLCIGGSFALLLSRTGQYRVAIPFYGMTPADLDGACPVVASYGERDRTFAAQGRKLEEELTKRGVPHDVKGYPGAGHSFMNGPPNAVVGALMGMAGAGYREDAARDATARVVSFLREHV